MIPASPRRILLVDADAFYVAVARMIDPEGAGKATLLIVGGARESRGVVCSASYETRRFGVRSAMPTSQALRLCPDAMCVPVPHRQCSVKSREIADVLDRFAPVVESASIDEWYLDLAGTEGLFHHEPLAETARRIRETVVKETGLTVSIGGGVSKLVAKLAVERAKPSVGAAGVHIVAPGDEAAFLRGFALAEIPQVGPRFQERLAKLGMHRVPDVLQYDLDTLRAWLGMRDAEWLHERVLGRDDAVVQPRSEVKSISRDETFPADIHDDCRLEEELLRLVVRGASDLRGDKLRARTITVRIRDHDFKSRQASHTLSEVVEADRVIFDVARALLAKLRKARRVPARRLTVALSSLARSAIGEQLALLDDGRAHRETERDRTLSRTVDRLRDRFGDDAIVPARLRHQ